MYNVTHLWPRYGPIQLYFTAGIPPEANLGLCYRGFQKYFFQPAADLPTQPPVQHSNAETPLHHDKGMAYKKECASFPTHFPPKPPAPQMNTID